MPYIGNQHNVGDHVNNFKVLDDISSYTATFDGSATSVVSTSAETIRIPEHRFIQGQRVTYNNGGGSNIGGLTSGTAYYVSFDSANTIKLATSLANANSNNVINLSTVGGGTSHTLNAAFDGINTKFKLTFGSGNSARLNNATQINVAINNVIQRPNLDANNFADGFALADNHKIVFKTAPTSQDIFWGSIISNTIENFDLRDNEVDNFTGNGSATEFNLSTIPANNESVIVTIDGVLQHPSDKNTSRAYTLLSNIIQFTAAPALNAEIQVRHIGFAGASTNDVSGFYGRTGNVTLTANDHITTGDITSRNINASGIITAASANFGGNVSIGGTLTYEDVANIDSVGIITARSNIDCNGDLDVDGHTNLDNVSIAGITTIASQLFSGKVKISSDLNALSAPSTADYYHLHLTNPQNDVGETVGIAFGLSTGGDIGAAITHEREGSTSFGNLRFYTKENSSPASMLERMRITKDGRVGIGTTNPTGAQKLNVYADSTGTGGLVQITQQGTGDAAIDFQIKGLREYSLGIDNSDDDKFKLSSTAGLDSNTIFTATTGGYFGIGTNNPESPLVVRNANNTLGIFTSTDDGANIDLFDDDTQSRIRSVDGRLHLYADFHGGVGSGNVSDSSIRFFVDGNNEKVRIASDGNVGIGSQNPSKKLSIVTGNNLGISLINNTDFATAGIYLEGGRNSGTGIVGELQFYNRRNSGVTSKLLVNGDGDFNFDGTNTNSKVGINSISPEKQLVVRTGSGGDGGILVKPNVNYANNQDRAYLIVATDGFGLGGSNWNDYGFQHRIKSNSSGTSRVTIDTSSGEAFCVKNGGNVGIGTNDPVRPLHIHSADCRIRLEDAGIATDVELQNHSGDGVLTTNGLSNVRLQTNNLERLRITSTGNVGINSTNPSTKLDVVGSIRAYDSSTGFVSMNSTGNIEIRRGTGGFIDFSTAASEDYDCRIKQEDNGLAFLTGGQGSTAERLRITSGGDVGIGTAAPQAKFHVVQSGADGVGVIIGDKSGSSNSPGMQIFGKRQDGNDSQCFSGRIGLIHHRPDAKIDAGKPLGTIYFGGNHTDSSYSNILYPASISAKAGDSFDSATDMPTDLVFYTGTSGISWTQANASAGTERLRITAEGDIYTTGNGVRDDARLTIEKNKVGVSTAIHIHNANGSGTASKISTSKGLILSADVENNTGADRSFISLHVDNSEKLRIDSNGYVTKPNNAMFKATMTTSRTITSNGFHKIQYDTDSAAHCFDVGNNFSTSNHRFTAPVTGYYQFGCNQRFDSGNGDYFRLLFYKNGSADSGFPHGMAIYRDNDGFNYISLTITSLIQLNANEYVEAWAYSSSDTSWTLHRESIFYGYLVG